jgi:S-adenosylmethionine hydrolase
VRLDVAHAELADSGFKLGHGVDVNGHAGVYATTFADVPAGELILYEDAYRTLALAVNRGSARELLGVERDGELRIRARG